MATKWKPGDKVKFEPPVISGTIVDAMLDKGSLEIRYLVEWRDAAETVHQRWFEPDQLVARD